MIICLPALSVPAVAPLAGAWIEIIRGAKAPITVLVAPLAGAWIEIFSRSRK